MSKQSLTKPSRGALEALLQRRSVNSGIDIIDPSELLVTPSEEAQRAAQRIISDFNRGARRETLTDISLPAEANASKYAQQLGASIVEYGSRVALVDAVTAAISQPATDAAEHGLLSFKRADSFGFVFVHQAEDLTADQLERADRLRRLLRNGLDLPAAWVSLEPVAEPVTATVPLVTPATAPQTTLSAA